MLLFSSNCFFMKALFWNCRGIGKKVASDRVRYLREVNNLSLIILMESHLNRRRSRNFIRRFGRDWSGNFFPGNGRSGGLMVLWRHTLFTCSLIYAANSIMHFLVADSAHHIWLLSAVYGSCSSLARNSLWQALSKLSIGSLPWLIVGDFNCTLSPQDKRGGVQFSDSNSTREFQSFLFSQGLIDLGFSGSKFTWCNNRPFADRVWVRLDRAFSNHEFVNCFPNFSVFHLTRTGSDHAPLLLQFTRPVLSFCKPFRFEHFWLDDDEIKSIVQKVQNLVIHHPLANSLEIIPSKLNALQSMLRHWNRASFGVLETRLAEVDKPIKDLELKDLGVSPPPELVAALRAAHNKQAALLRLINIKWQSKARISWNINRDLNTTYFHRVTLMHRRRNRILFIKDADGAIYDSDHDIRRIFTHHYASLWGMQVAARAGDLAHFPFVAKVGQVHRDSLCRPFTPAEIFLTARPLGRMAFMRSSIVSTGKSWGGVLFLLPRLSIASRFCLLVGVPLIFALFLKPRAPVG